MKKKTSIRLVNPDDANLEWIQNDGVSSALAQPRETRKERKETHSVTLVTGYEHKLEISFKSCNDLIKGSLRSVNLDVQIFLGTVRTKKKKFIASHKHKWDTSRDEAFQK